VTTLTFDAYWRDHGVARGLKGLGSDAETSTKHVKTLGDHGKQLAAGFAGFAAASIFHSFIEGARESNMISRVTEQRIRSTGGAAHVTAAQVGDLAQAISNKTGADDEAVQSGANMLLTFTGVRNEVGKGNDVFNQATAAATDLAAGLHQGQVTAEGAQGAATLLGKALNDPIAGMTALRRVGISFTASQVQQITALQKSGRTLEAQKVILGEVNREFGGTAKAAADPLQRMSVILGNVGEDIGNKLLPALNEGADVLAAIPEPVYVLGAGFVTLGVGAIGLAKGINAVRDISQGTAGVMRILGLRTGEAAAAQVVEAGAAEGAAVKTALAGNAAAGASTKFKALGGAAAGVGIVIGGVSLGNWISDASVADVSTDDLAASLTHLNDQSKNTAFRDLFDRAGLGPFQVQASDTAEALDQLAGAADIAFGQGWAEKTQRIASFGVASREAEGQIHDLDGALASMVSSGKIVEAHQAFATLTDRLRKAGFSVDEVTRMFPAFTAAEHEAAAKADATTRAIGDQNSALRGVQHGGNIATTALRGVITATDGATAAARRHRDATKAELVAMDANAQQVLDLRQRDRDLAAARADLTDAIKTNKRGLDLNTAAGRANGDALDRAAKATRGDLQAHRDAAEPMRRYTQRVRDSEAALIAEARRAGMSRDAATRYARAILAVPRRQVTDYQARNLANVRRNVQGLHSDILRISGRTVTIRMNADGTATRIFTAAGRTTSTKYYAGGGRVSGPGGPREDRVPAMLSPGEFVVNAAATSRHGQLLEAINAQRLAAGGLVNVRSGATRLPIGFGDATTLGLATLAGQAYKSGALFGGGMAGPMPGGSGVARWAPTILRALAMLGQSPGWLGTVESRMNRESGGNPTIVNRWDSNWIAGTPSVGLMQVIGPTYRAYAGPFRRTGPFLYGVSTNGLANTYAGLNYAVHRYGSLGALSRPGGYDSGGVAHGRGWIPKPTAAPERVLSPRQTVAFERLMPLLERGGAGGVTYNITVNAPNYLGGRGDLYDELERGARQGRLRQIVRVATRG
jgi:hypothetical protein